MLQHSLDLLFFSAKFLIAVIMLLLLLAGVLALIFRSRGKSPGQLQLTSLNQKYTDTKEALFTEILSKEEYKTHKKNLKKKLNDEKKQNFKKNTLFVLNFQGDIRATAVSALREEITAILSVATPQDEVMLRLESPGGMVHAYGLATAQLQRLRAKGIRLTVIVDKVAASGGYMMACIADQLIAAPFAIIGSIGVILQMPNFNRLLKEQHIDFEQITAGRHKRTLTVFGPNTEEGRKKSREEVEAIHTLFKQLVQQYRPDTDIDKVTTGEHWSGLESLPLKLIDALGTSDDFLLKQADTWRLLEVAFQQKKTFMEKFMGAKNQLLNALQTHSLPW